MSGQWSQTSVAMPQPPPPVVKCISCSAACAHPIEDHVGLWLHSVSVYFFVFWFKLHYLPVPVVALWSFSVHLKKDCTQRLKRRQITFQKRPKDSAGCMEIVWLCVCVPVSILIGCLHACVSVDEEVVNDERVVRFFTSPGQKWDGWHMRLPRAAVRTHCQLQSLQPSIFSGLVSPSAHSLLWAS